MPILKKEFYFLRHGETTYNAEQLLSDADISINENGIKQAETIKEIIAKLPIKTICYSPLKRAIETKNIATRALKCLEIEISELRECSGSIWMEIMKLEKNSQHPVAQGVSDFFSQAIIGINRALDHAGPVLIIAHGGIHWTLCHLMGLNEEKKIGNCIPVHFRPNEKNNWEKKALFLEHLG